MSEPRITVIGAGEVDSSTARRALPDASASGAAARASEPAIEPGRP
jgi:hypothetical protein